VYCSAVCAASVACDQCYRHESLCHVAESRADQWRHSELSSDLLAGGLSRGQCKSVAACHSECLQYNGTEPGNQIQRSGIVFSSRLLVKHCTGWL